VGGRATLQAQLITRRLMEVLHEQFVVVAAFGEARRA
jgi:hypothetical protein